MDLEFLTTEQMEMSLKLCDILSMEDITVAAAVLASFNWNMESALSQLQLGPNQNNAAPAPPIYNPLPIVPNQYNYDYQEMEEEEQQNNYEYDYDYNNNLIEQKKKYFEEEYASLIPLQKTLSEPNKQLGVLQFHKTLALESKSHREDYMINLMNQSQKICKDILESSTQKKKKYNESRQRIQNNRHFINTLYKNYKPRINFTFGTFFLNLTRAYLQGKHLLVYIHSIDPQTDTKFKKILQLIFQQKQIAKFVNQNCIVYGMFDNSDDYQILQKHVPLKDLPGFAIFRLNKSKRQEQYISHYAISSQKEIFLEWLADKIGIKLRRRESNQQFIQKQQELKKQSQVQQLAKKKEEQRIIAQLKKQQEYINQRFVRQEQDKLYHQIEKTFLQKRQLSKDRKDKISEDEENLQKRIEEASKQIEPQSGANVIEIRFRVPITGQSKNRRFLLSDKVEKCFTYVDCFCRDQFQEKFSDFDLIQTFPNIILSQLKDKTLDEVFEGSNRQNVIIREK